MQDRSEDQYGKYVRLFGTLFFTFLGFVCAGLLLMLLLRYVFGLLDHIPGASVFFTFLILCVPPAIFITAFLIFFYRTKKHPSKGARMFSYCLFFCAFASWTVFFVKDLIYFFRSFSPAIEGYMSYHLAFLAANVFAIFLVGIVQALATEKETDWMERTKEQPNNQQPS